MSERPHRVQLRRTKGWRLPPGTMSVARPTPWGNPWRVAGDITPVLAVALHRADTERLVALGRLDLSPLRGRNLACWCDLAAPCHADTLLELAARP